MTTTPVLVHCTATNQAINYPHYGVEKRVWKEFWDHSVEDPQWNIPHYSTAAMLGVNEGDTEHNPMQQPNRQTIISRIQKLSALTRENGATEHEAIAAAQAIAKLMAEYNITETEAQLKLERSSCHRDHFYILATAPREFRFCEPILNKLYNVRIWGRSECEDMLNLGHPIDILKLNAFGYPTDVAAALSTLEIIYYAINFEASAYSKSNLKGQRGDIKRWLLQSFRLGMAKRLIDRLEALISTPVQSTGTSLIILKNQIVREEFSKLNIQLSSRPNNAFRVDHVAYAAGQQAGNIVDIGQTKVAKSPLSISAQ